MNTTQTFEQGDVVEVRVGGAKGQLAKVHSVRVDGKVTVKLPNGQGWSYAARSLKLVATPTIIEADHAAALAENVVRSAHPSADLVLTSTDETAADRDMIARFAADPHAFSGSIGSIQRAQARLAWRIERDHAEALAGELRERARMDLWSARIAHAIVAGSVANTFQAHELLRARDHAGALAEAGARAVLVARREDSTSGPVVAYGQAKRCTPAHLDMAAGHRAILERLHVEALAEDARRRTVNGRVAWDRRGYVDGVSLATDELLRSALGSSTVLGPRQTRQILARLADAEMRLAALS
jgi:hypothetical protein